jgi:hypothetical protein
MSGAHLDARIPPLSDLVTAYGAERPGQPPKPYELARGITAPLDGRQVGTSAVLNCCLHLVTTGHLVQAADTPIGFRLPGHRPAGRRRRHQAVLTSFHPFAGPSACSAPHPF